ncbi:MAG TPA: dipeptide/oligopeptide/nickel ABC transporter ATP-binding protein [Chlamydiales bacterium]|nr:dipeptide/oligopeptide/nickel ABC transporter ATP-binding protein [Chlamydiales bacterium]
MIEVRKLTKIFYSRKERTEALSDLTFSIQKGEIFSLIGESGCGKSTLAHLLMGLLEPTSGEIFFNGKEMTNKRERSLALHMQIVFQDSLSSLHPRMCVEDLINEPLKIWGKKERAEELLHLVGLPESLKKRVPHELSGGQRQRVSIARALSLNPSFLIFDEALSSLDLLTQKQIIDLLIDLQKTFNLTYLFISHDHALVRSFSDQIAELRQGKLKSIEKNGAARLF